MERSSHQVAADGAIRVNVTLPVTRVGFGPFSFDPVEQMIGAPVADILESLMTGPVTRRPSATGPAVEVYPLALPRGEGASIPLGQWGEVGFRNEDGLLVLTVPMQARRWVQERLAEAIAFGPVPGLSSDGRARVVDYGLALHPGMAACMPLGALGEIGIEAR